jgi:hypothetical protein
VPHYIISQEIKIMTVKMCQKEKDVGWNKTEFKKLKLQLWLLKITFSSLREKTYNVLFIFEN